MIFPSGNPRNRVHNPLESLPPQRDPSSPQYERQFKVRAEKRRDRSWEKVKEATRLLDVAKDVLRSGSSIMPARAAKLSDVGGPVRSMRAATSNSVTDPHVIDRLAAGEVRLDRGSEIREANKKVAEAREAARKEQFKIDPEQVKAAMRPGAAIQSSRMHLSDGQNNGLRVAPHQFGLFDRADKLDTLRDPTKGTEIRRAVANRRDRSDRSWQRVESPQTTKGKLDAFFQNLRQVAAESQRNGQA